MHVDESTDVSLIYDKLCDWLAGCTVSDFANFSTGFLTDEQEDDVRVAFTLLIASYRIELTVCDIVSRSRRKEKLAAPTCERRVNVA